MSTEQTKVAANTTWFTMALVLQKIISFVYFTYLARVLGAENLGQYVFALSFVAIFSIIVDFGTNHFITREVAKDHMLSQKLLSNIFGFKIFSSILAISSIFLVINLLDYQLLTKQLILIATFLMLVESLVISSYAIIRGWHNLKFESFGTIGVQFLVTIVGIIILQFTTDLKILLAVLLGINILNLIYVLILLHWKIKLKIKLSFDFSYWKKIFLIILPFALAAGFTKIYGAFDQVLLSKLASNVALGFYAVAYKLTFSLQFLPLALVASLYPAMSTYFTHDKEMLNKSFTRAVYYLIILTIPLMFGVIFLAEKFILTLYTSEYIGSILPLQILIASLLFLFINFPLGSLLNAANKQARNTLNIGLAMVMNISLNLFLIPIYQAVGAAIASFLSTLFLFILNWLVAKNLLKIDYKYLFAVAIKTFISSGLMLLAIFFSLDYFNWLVSAIFGAIFYLIFQVVFKSITPRDIKQVLFSFKNR